MLVQFPITTSLTIEKSSHSLRITIFETKNSSYRKLLMYTRTVAYIFALAFDKLTECSVEGHKTNAVRTV